MQFRSLLDKLPAGGYTCDPNGLITHFNEHAVKLWGRAPKLNDPVDRFCGSFKLFARDGSPITHDACWMALALQTGKEFNGEEIIIERKHQRKAPPIAGLCRIATWLWLRFVASPQRMPVLRYRR